MTGNQVVAAHRAVTELWEVVLPYKEARGLARLKKALEEEVRTIDEQAGKIAWSYGGTPSGNGMYKFEDPAALKACQEELERFRGQEDEVDLPRVDLSRFVEQLRLSPASVEALEGIVIFEVSDT